MPSNYRLHPRPLLEETVLTYYAHMSDLRIKLERRDRFFRCAQVFHNGAAEARRMLSGAPDDLWSKRSTLSTIYGSSSGNCQVMAKFGFRDPDICELFIIENLSIRDPDEEFTQAMNARDEQSAIDDMTCSDV